MKVNELIKKLSSLDPNLIVVLSRDEEGNGFHELAEIADNHVYDDGEIYIKELTPELIKEGYSEEDVLTEGKDCVVLWP